MENSNLVLLGMPGAGKSTLGVLLAKSLCMPFIDTDLIIQHQENRFLQEIIDQEGLEGFLAIENETILSLDVKKHVIATGGSVIHSKLAMEHLKSRGTLLYLQLSYQEIEKRIKNITTRGIAKNGNQSLFDLYTERVPLYVRYADMLVSCSGKEMEALVCEIQALFKNYKK